MNNDLNLPAGSNAKPTRNKALLPIFLVVAVDVLGLTFVLPLLPFYAERYGATPQTVGFLVTAFALCQLLAGPVLGQLSDRYGRRRLLIVSQVGTLIGFLILGVANSLFLVFLSRIIDGITAGNLSLAQAYISDVTEPKDRAKSFGIIGIAFGLGFLIGPAVSGFLAGYSYRYPVYLASFLSFTSIMATTFYLPEVKPGHLQTPNPNANSSSSPAAPGGKRLSLFSWGQYVKYFKTPVLGGLLLEFMMFMLGFSIFISGFALFAERRFTLHGMPFGPREVGYLYAFSGFMGLIVQGGLLGRLVKRFGERKLVMTGFLSMSFGYALLSGVHWIPAILIASAFGSFGTGVLRPALTSLITQSVGRHEQGLVLGLNQSLNSVAQIVAPVLSGFLINEGLLTFWPLSAASMGLIGLYLSWRSRATRKAVFA
jgi:MFS transporter, DHA1 family, tetracycline resistance protein